MLTPQETYPRRLGQTILLVVAVVAVLAGAIWLAAHRPKDPAFRSEWRCLPIPDATVCERVKGRPANAP